MSPASPTHDNIPRPGRAAGWTGRVLSGLVAVMLILSASAKFAGGPALEANLAHFGFSAALVPTLGVIELASVILYLVPHTAVLGAILLTGYLGGAAAAHMRIDESPLVPMLIGVVAWLALYLRDPRLRRLVPLRSR